MTIREDLVASAANFLRDPSVSASPVENRIAFLKAKNLTEEEVQDALARAGGEPAPAVAAYLAPPSASVPERPAAYYGGYPAYGWQPPQPQLPKRDWRDWFIMATVVGGVGYGMYALGKRYIYPLVAPPTPERLESDKKSIDERFEKAFVLVEQLVKDTEELKAAEVQRNERLNNAMDELETAIGHLKSANSRREDEGRRIRDDFQALKDSIPKALDAQKKLADTRLQEVNSELKSLKTITSQRLMSQPAATSIYPNRVSATGPPSAPAAVPAIGNEMKDANRTANGHTTRDDMVRPNDSADDVFSPGRASPLSSGVPAPALKIPEWQRAMALKSNSTPAMDKISEAEASGGSS